MVLFAVLHVRYPGDLKFRQGTSKPAQMRFHVGEKADIINPCHIQPDKHHYIHAPLLSQSKIQLLQSFEVISYLQGVWIQDDLFTSTSGEGTEIKARNPTLATLLRY